ncbi:MAG TPA: hypothetical protein PKA28_19565 [Methylomusa anaerophila]|uniref:Uncharacterized protein n=2 Tax=Methylomusa anaerophila TaxID=1930071 RepID=A0A348AIE2_9FIRM|nr:hypothetical protein [Methylomusa anaerophila]BBB90840.1 hypothetical protein MAMMFC1_01503 [Methylomusa anaerophila]HML90634.1 hypothetical protein [Methylomusa anaerophila]
MIIHRGHIWAATMEELLEKITIYLAHGGYTALAEPRTRPVREQAVLTCYEWKATAVRTGMEINGSEDS